MLSKFLTDSEASRVAEAGYTWHFITPEYPPDLGGVADYTRQVAHRLHEAGETIHVWSPGDQDSVVLEQGVWVHRVAGGMRPSQLRAMRRKLDELKGPQKMLVQWVPHGFGYRSMNLFLCEWLWSLSRSSYEIELMIHEPFLRFLEGSRRQDGVAVVHRVMMMVLLQAAKRVWVSTPDWTKASRPWALGRDVPFTWLPVQSNVLPSGDRDLVASAAAEAHALGGEIVGHFGTFGNTRKLIRPVLAALFQNRPGVGVLLIGNGSVQFRDQLTREYPQWAARLRATGPLEQRQLSAFLQVCDVFVQPFADGVNGRRGSVMALLAHAKPVVTTEGRATESIWRDRDAVCLVPNGRAAELVDAVSGLLEDRSRRQALGRKGFRLYDEVFDLRHTIRALRQPGDVFACES